MKYFGGRALLVATTLVFSGCNLIPPEPIDNIREKATSGTEVEAKNYRLTRTSTILVTSEAGAKLAPQANIVFEEGTSADATIVVRPDVIKQTIVGIGSSFTESSAFVLAHLDKPRRDALLQNVYGASGANFSLARTPIASTDFSVEGKTSYASVPGDKALEHFTIAPDIDGFDKTEYPGIRDESFDVLPMIQQALAIKEGQKDKQFRIVASAWTAPPWMKDIETWYIPPTPENNYLGTGGQLKPEYQATYADYLIRYLDSYQQAGVDIWGLTPVNEPNGNSGQWESMHFTPESQRDFIKQHLGPKLRSSQHDHINLLIYDQNRDHLEDWTDVILGDKEAAQYVYGTAVHWYSSTEKVYEETLERVHKKFPEFDIIHTEGTIDDLGKLAPGGVTDPEGFQEEDWFGNDAFWWNKTATDWAYSATWAPKPEDHPMYTPVHRYARNIIVSLNHWMSGWIDWNIVLDSQGGPNHVGNYCGAPIMIDLASREIYYTPIYHVLSQFSRTIRPGDKAVQVDTYLGDMDDDALHVNATINSDGLLTVQVLNTTKQALRPILQIGAQQADLKLPANSLQSVQVQLPRL